ncbi:MAG: tyrosine-type recombinase/integrase, partial [Candidatus Competibacteraceae bacterium]
FTEKLLEFNTLVFRQSLNPQAVTPHTLRHTAITHLVQTGVDLPTVQRISGHRTLAMVARYIHQSGEHIASAMYRLSERVTQGTKNLTGNCGKVLIFWLPSADSNHGQGD